MGILTDDLSEVKTVSVSHPSEAPTLLGREFVTPWFTMDEDRANMFEKGTYLDSYPHRYGGDDAYGDDLVEGFHLLGMFDFLLNHSIWSEGPWIAWNYGVDKARFVSVIRRSDPFRLRGTIVDVVDRGAQGHLVVVDVVGEVRGRAKPGFVATSRALWTTAG